MDQRHIDRVTRAVLARRPTTTLTVNQIPPQGMEAGDFIRIDRTGEVMRIVGIDREANELEVERMPRG